MPRPTTLYSVDAYAFGCAFDEPATLAPTLESALAVLADELDAYADYVADDPEELDEPGERERALATLDTLKRAADAWGEACAGAAYSRRSTREPLESVLALRAPGEDGPAEDGESLPSAWRVELLAPFTIDIREPGSTARGRTFVLETVALSEVLEAFGVDSLDALEEIAESDHEAAALLDALDA